MDEKEILGLRKTAIVGLSPDEGRPSNIVARFLISKGREIFPVNPNEKEILGRNCFSSLEEIPEKIEIAVVFRKPEAVPEIIESAIKVGAKAVWLQEGITSPSLEIARRAGLSTVEDKCIMKEMKKLLP